MATFWCKFTTVTFKSMLACCHVTKSTQLIEEEGLIRWKIAIITTDKFTFLLIEFQQWKKQWEAIQAVVLLSMGKSCWSVYHILSIRRCNWHLRAPKSKSFVKELQIHSLKIMCTQYVCYEWTWVAHKDNQVDGEKTQLSGNRVVQFIFAIFSKNNYLSIMWMWFICLKKSRVQLCVTSTCAFLVYKWRSHVLYCLE